MTHDLKQFARWLLTAFSTSTVFGYWQQSWAAGIFMFFFLVSLYGIVAQLTTE